MELNNKTTIARHAFIFLIILKKISCLPLPLLQRLILSLVMEIKKDVGKTFIAYPTIQAFALPMHKDKQLSQPTPLGIIYNVYCRSFDLQA